MSREIHSASTNEDLPYATVRQAIADKLSLAGAAALTSGMATVVAHSLLAIASPSSFTDAALTQFLSSLSANWLSQIVWDLRGKLVRRATNRTKEQQDNRWKPGGLTQQLSHSDKAEELKTLRELSGDIIQQLSDRDLSAVLARLGVIETTLRAAEAAQVDATALTREMLQVGIATKEDINAAVARIRPSQSAQAQINTAINSTIITFVGDGNIFAFGETEAQRREYVLLEDIKMHRAQLAIRHAPLDLRGFDITAQASAVGGSLQLKLENVYTPLFVRRLADGRTAKTAVIRGKEGANDRSDRISIVEALNDAPRTVILGKGGSGKSTILKHVVLGLCGEGDEFDQDWRHGPLLPIWVTLREFVDYAHARSVGPCQNAEQEEVRTEFNRWLKDDPVEALIDFVIDDLKRAGGRRKQALPHLAENLEEWLSERGGVFLLDGLDEVPSAQRLMVRNAIAGLAARFPRCRQIVACRPYSYRDEQNADADRSLKIAPGGKPFAELDVLSLDMPQIDFFVRHWYSQLAELMPDLAPEAANRRAEELIAQIVRDERLSVLAKTPLLLTLIGSLHGLRNRRLPNERWALLKQTVDLLLVSWQRRKLVDSAIPSAFGAAEARIHEALDAKRGEALLARLYQLAYDVHAGATKLDQSVASDITERQLMAALRDVLPRTVEASDLELAQYLRDRAGLILDEGGKDGKEHIFLFPHRMFEEYLSACHMVDSYGTVAKMIDEDYERWQEVYALLALMSENAVFTMTCVKRLFPQPPASAADWRRVDLAVGIWADFPRFRLETLLKDASHDVTQHIEEIRAWLLVRMSDTKGTRAPERARVGDALARLVDPRFDPEHWFLPKEPLLGFKRIEADPGFRIGTRASDFERVKTILGGVDPYRDEINDAPTPTPEFYVATYMVTVAQFRAFVDATGMKVSHEDSLREPDNRPVRWVTWLDAMKYCMWLDVQLKSDSAPAQLREMLLSGKWRTTLPSEVEWEKAARGGLSDKVFSWGDDVNPAMANYDDTRISVTTAVGCFPANGYGLHDMIGNVWEWTRSKYKPYPYGNSDDLGDQNLEINESHVVRGGAFSCRHRSARCAVRGGSRLGYEVDLNGFRVVLSPS